MKLYPLILMDIPWPWQVRNRETGMDRAPMYPTMAMEDIFALRVPAAGDCIIFMWATVPLLSEALDLIKALGFTYKSHFVWMKKMFPNLPKLEMFARKKCRGWTVWGNEINEEDEA